jgi:hypothetical protein
MSSESDRNDRELDDTRAWIVIAVLVGLASALGWAVLLHAWNIV